MSAPASQASRISVGREAARHRRDVALVAGVDHRRGGTPGRRRSARRRRSTARAVSASVTVPAPSRNPAGSVGASSRDQLDRARHRHRHFERADAALGERVDDGAQPRRILRSGSPPRRQPVPPPPSPLRARCSSGSKLTVSNDGVQGIGWAKQSHGSMGSSEGSRVIDEVGIYRVRGFDRFAVRMASCVRGESEDEPLEP